MGTGDAGTHTSDTKIYLSVMFHVSRSDYAQDQPTQCQVLQEEGNAK